jgi:sodium/potassium-transporting ATPase subunit alpha
LVAVLIELFPNFPLHHQNWADGFMGHSIDELNHFVNVGQCVYFVTLVIMQLFGNLFASRTRRLSVLQKNPFWGPSRNLRIPIAMCISIAIVIIVSTSLKICMYVKTVYSLSVSFYQILYVPFFNNVFQTAPIPLEFWFIPIPLAIGMLLMDETRKLLVRSYPKSFIAKIAW